MDWDRVEGNWKQVKGKLKEKWGQLTEDDLNVIDGRRDQFEESCRSDRAGRRTKVRKDVDDWLSAQR